MFFNEYAVYQTMKHHQEETEKNARNASGNQVGHFGFQVESTEEVIAHKQRLAENGILSQLDEINTTCCYALRDKFWVHDPDGNEWEFFYTKRMLRRRVPMQHLAAFLPEFLNQRIPTTAVLNIHIQKGSPAFETLFAYLP
ncbi:VOC family protein [Neobacillus sp. PS3-12]|jgi:hypothetical protein|uniref:VOC family protein n=1 Tax=Neobacillus sp. PS3-12 TaxID=3070677 RepID=UPI0035A8D10A